MKSFSPVCNSCTIMPAAAIMASRPFCSSFVCIVFSSSGSVGFSPSGSKPRSPDSKSDRISHGLPPSSPFRANRAGVLKLKTENISGSAIATTTVGQNVWSGVCWNAR